MADEKAEAFAFGAYEAALREPASVRHLAGMGVVLSDTEARVLVGTAVRPPVLDTHAVADADLASVHTLPRTAYPARRLAYLCAREWPTLALDRSVPCVPFRASALPEQLLPELAERTPSTPSTPRDAPKVRRTCTHGAYDAA